MTPTRIALVMMAAFTLSSPVLADLRTKHIRLVPSKEWVAPKGPVALSSEVSATGEGMAELGPAFDKWIRWGLEELGYQVAAEAPVKVHYTIDTFTSGSAAKRFFVPGSSGGSYLHGRLVISKDGEELGAYEFTSRPRGGITNADLDDMAKEVAPTLILKWSKGDKDAELHEAPKPEEKD